ncbi:hypothetical protein CBR_g60055 [Chara braunii]|uniref:Uncharacterized protein n=1 Tax=Chara braunii TaxID=69332 RepID=A0A388K8L2_CHABU|nr:hypothetical protein CBR_g60055 [Chara braunii]|eukprot:GBG66402.1 hypothetical protein CBR_g60055 [Chara braunii]
MPYWLASVVTVNGLSGSGSFKTSWCAKECFRCLKAASHLSVHSHGVSRRVRRKKRSTSKTLPLDDASAVGEDKVKNEKNNDSGDELEIGSCQYETSDCDDHDNGRSSAPAECTTPFSSSSTAAAASHSRQHLGQATSTPVNNASEQHVPDPKPSTDQLSVPHSSIMPVAAPGIGTHTVEPATAPARNEPADQSESELEMPSYCYSRPQSSVSSPRTQSSSSSIPSSVIIGAMLTTSEASVTHMSTASDLAAKQTTTENPLTGVSSSSELSPFLPSSLQPLAPCDLSGTTAPAVSNVSSPSPFAPTPQPPPPPPPPLPLSAFSFLHSSPPSPPTATAASTLSKEEASLPCDSCTPASAASTSVAESQAASLTCTMPAHDESPLGGDGSGGPPHIPSAKIAEAMVNERSVHENVHDAAVADAAATIMQSAFRGYRVRKFYRKNWQSMKLLHITSLERNKLVPPGNSGGQGEQQADADDENVVGEVKREVGWRMEEADEQQERDADNIQMDDGSGCTRSDGHAIPFLCKLHEAPHAPLTKDVSDDVACEEEGAAEKVVEVCESSCYGNWGVSDSSHSAKVTKPREQYDPAHSIGRFAAPAAEGFVGFPVPVNFSSFSMEGLSLSELGLRRVGRRRRLLVSTSMGSLPSYGRRLSPSVSRTSIRTERVGNFKGKQGFNLFLRAKSQRERDMAMARRSRAQTYGTIHQHWSRQHGQTMGMVPGVLRREAGGAGGKGSKHNGPETGKPRGGWGWVLLESWMLDRPWRNRYFRDPNDPTGMYLMEWIPPDHLALARAPLMEEECGNGNRRRSSSVGAMGGHGRKEVSSLAGAPHTPAVNEDALPAHRRSERTAPRAQGGRAATRSGPPSGSTAGQSSEPSAAVCAIPQGTQKDSTLGPHQSSQTGHYSGVRHTQTQALSTAAVTRDAVHCTEKMSAAAVTRDAVHCTEKMSAAAVTRDAVHYTEKTSDEGKNCGVAAESEGGRVAVAAAAVTAVQGHKHSGQHSTTGGGECTDEGASDAHNLESGCQPYNGHASKAAAMTTSTPSASTGKVGNKEGGSLTGKDGAEVSRRLAFNFDPLRTPWVVDSLPPSTGASTESHGVSLCEQEEPPMDKAMYVGCDNEGDVNTEPVFRRVLAKPIWRSRSSSKSNDSSGLRHSGSGSSVTSAMSPYQSSENLFQKAAHEADFSVDSKILSTDNCLERCGPSSAAQVAKPEGTLSETAMTQQITGREAALSKSKGSEIEVLRKTWTGKSGTETKSQSGVDGGEGEGKGELMGSATSDREVSASCTGRLSTSAQKVTLKDMGNQASVAEWLKSIKKNSENDHSPSARVVATKRVLPEFQLASSAVGPDPIQKANTAEDGGEGVSKAEEKSLPSSLSPMENRGEVPTVSAVLSSAHFGGSAEWTSDRADEIQVQPTRLSSAGSAVVEPSAAALSSGVQGQSHPLPNSMSNQNALPNSTEDEKMDKINSRCAKEEKADMSRAGCMGLREQQLSGLSAMVRGKGEGVRTTTDKLQEGDKVGLGSGNVNKRYSLPATGLPTTSMRRQAFSLGESSPFVGDAAANKEEPPTDEGDRTRSSREEPAGPPCLPSETSPEQRKLRSPMRSVSPSLKPRNRHDVSGTEPTLDTSVPSHRSYARRPVSAGPSVGMGKFSDPASANTQRKLLPDTERTTSTMIPRYRQSIATYMPLSSCGSAGDRRPLSNVTATKDDLRASAQRLAAAWHVPAKKLGVSASMSFIPSTLSKSPIEDKANSSAMLSSSAKALSLKGTTSTMHGRVKAKDVGRSVDASPVQCTRIPLPSNAESSTLDRSHLVRESDDKRRFSTGTRRPVLTPVEEQAATSAGGSGVTNSTVMPSSPVEPSKRNPQNVMISACYTPAGANDRAQLDRDLIPLVQLGASPGSESRALDDSASTHSTEPDGRNEDRHPRTRALAAVQTAGSRATCQLANSLPVPLAMTESVEDTAADEKPETTRDLSTLFKKVLKTHVENDGEVLPKESSGLAELREGYGVVTRDQNDDDVGGGDDDGDDDTVVQHLPEGDSEETEPEEAAAASLCTSQSGLKPEQEPLGAQGAQKGGGKEGSIAVASSSSSITNKKPRYKSSSHVCKSSASVDASSGSIRASLSLQKGDPIGEQEVAKSKTLSGISPTTPDPSTRPHSGRGRSQSGTATACGKGRDAPVGKQQQQMRTSITKPLRPLDVEAQTHAQEGKSHNSRLPSGPQAVKKASKVTTGVSSPRGNVSEDALAAVRLSFQQCAAAGQTRAGSKSRAPVSESGRVSLSSVGPMGHHPDDEREADADSKADRCLTDDSHAREGVRVSVDGAQNDAAKGINVGVRDSARITECPETSQGVSHRAMGASDEARMHGPALDSMDGTKCDAPERSERSASVCPSRSGLKKPAVSRVYDHLSESSRPNLHHSAPNVRKLDGGTGTTARKSMSKADMHAVGTQSPHRRSSYPPSALRVVSAGSAEASSSDGKSSQHSRSADTAKAHKMEESASSKSTRYSIRPLLNGTGSGTILLSPDCNVKEVGKQQRSGRRGEGKGRARRGGGEEGKEENDKEEEEEEREKASR